MEYIIDVPEDRIENGRLRIMAEIKDGNYRWIETGIMVKHYHGDGDEAEQRGIEKAWKLAQAIDAMDSEDWIACLGKPYIQGQLKRMSYTEVRDKYEAWKKQKDEIKVGDEIIYDFEKAIVLDVVNESCCFVMTSKGYVTAIKKENIRKTGRHFDTVDLIVEKLKES